MHGALSTDTNMSDSRPIFGEPVPTRREVARAERAELKVLNRKAPKVYRAMTEDERRAALALSGPTYLSATPDKRFARDISSLAKQDGAQITDAQADYIWRMVYRYRRQIRESELVAMAEEKRRR